MKCKIVVGIMLLMSIAGRAQEKPGASSTPLTFGDAHVTVPPGWRHVETPSGANKAKVLLMVPPGNTEKKNLAVLLLPGQDLGGADFPQAVDAILKKGLAPHEHLVQYSELPVRKAAGYDFLTRAMIVADDAGHRSVRVCFGANPGHQLEMLIVSADSKETLKYYEADVSSLLASYSFDDASAPAVAKNEVSGAPPTPAHTDADVPDVPDVQGPNPGTNAKPERSNTPGGAKTVAPGVRARVPDGESVLLCADPSRLDGAMDFAKYGDSYNALRALRNDAFFRVTGPASLVVRESELKSRWPKVFVTVVDGDSAGRTGWVVLSELKDLKQPAK